MGMTADEFKTVKSIIKSTIQKRDGKGTGGKEEFMIYGDISSKANDVDSAGTPSSYEPIKAEQGQKTYGVLQKNFGKKHSEMVYPEKYRPIPSNFSLSYIQTLCQTLDREKANSNGSFQGTFQGQSYDLTKTDRDTLSAESSSCNAACTGLCIGSCISFCNGCSGCTASCGSGCAGNSMVDQKVK